MKLEFTTEQQSVIDARDCNILVSAAAGSGKTAVLVERIIQLILEGTDVDHLLVVTFTRAAAAQMKEKITAAIMEKLSEDPENQHLQRQESLIHNAQITTIDSFCQYVLKNNFNSIGFDPSFRVADETELKLLKEEVMEELFENEYIKAAKGDNDDFLYAMDYFSTGSDDKNVEGYIEKLFKYACSMPFPEDWINERSGDYACPDTDFDEIPFVKECMDHASDILSEALSTAKTAVELSLDPDGPYMYEELLSAEKEMIEKTLAIKGFDNLGEALRTFSFDTLSRKSDKSVNADKKEYVKKLRGKYKDSIKKLAGDLFSFDSESVLEKMKLCDRAVKELCRLTLLFKSGFDEKKREKQVIDFTDMEHLALKILLNHPDSSRCEGLSATEIFDLCTPTVAALEYRDFYKEVLIDEYQDSNNVQEMVLKAISGDDPEKSDRFMVGDVKQSIYKFRLARPEIFMEKFHGFDREAGAKNRRIDLHKNFRSRKEVLDLTNYIFARIMASDLGSVDYDEDAELVYGANYEDPTFDITPELILVDNEAALKKENSQAKNDEESPESEEDEDLGERDLSFEAYKELDLNSKEKEALAVAERIHELRAENQGLDFKDIVILLRSRSGWEDVFKRVLEDNGIPAYTESKTGYYDTTEISVLLNILSVIDNPGDDIALVSVMKSPIGGFEDEELALLRIAMDKREEKSPFDNFYTSLRGIKEGDIADDLYKRLSDFTDFIQDLRMKATYTPVHALLQYILDKTDYETIMTARPAGAQRKANIRQLVYQAAAFEKTSFKGLFHFVRYIEHIKTIDADTGEAGIIDENADVVRIMSIHKSKGLEFPVVFVSGMSKGFNKRDMSGDLLTEMDAGIGVKCIDVEKRIKSDTLRRKVISNKMLRESLGEELRVLYVALTRAKEKLIMTGYMKDAAKTLGDMLTALPELKSEGGLIPYSKRIGAKSYLDLVLSAVISHPAFRSAAERFDLDTGNLDIYGDKEVDARLNVNIINNEQLKEKMVLRGVTGIVSKDELGMYESLADSEMLSRIKEKFSRSYSHEELKGLYTKTTVTELKKKKLEEQEEVFAVAAEYAADNAEYADKTDDAANAEYADKTDDAVNADDSGTASIPAAKGRTKLTGAERGTAYHRVMELLDAGIYGDEELMKIAESFRADAAKGKEDSVSQNQQARRDGSGRIRSWMNEKVSQGLLPREFADTMYPQDVLRFLGSGLGKRMGAAYNNKRLFCEKPFMMGVPASDVKDSFPDSEMVLIQGIIDAYFLEGDDIILMDYKTDRVSDEQELIDRYRIQLDLYKRALESATDKKVKEIFIYSFALKKEIKLL